MKHHTRNRGYFALESAIALAVLMTLAAIFLTYSGQQKRGLDAFNDRRAAGRLAESALADLSQGHAVHDAHVTVRKLGTPSELPDRVWVEAEASINGRRVKMIGLVPHGGLKGVSDAAP